MYDFAHRIAAGEVFPSLSCSFKPFDPTVLIHHRRAISRHHALSPLVMELTAYRIRGAANKTTGVIIAHEIIHDLTHWLANIGLLKNGALEIPAATAQVSPD